MHDTLCLQFIWEVLVLVALLCDQLDKRLIDTINGYAQNTAVGEIKYLIKLTYPSPQSKWIKRMTVVQVTKEHAGNYTCTPYNTHGTNGSSGIMQVHVIEPPNQFDNLNRSMFCDMSKECSLEGRFEAVINDTHPLHLLKLDGRKLSIPQQVNDSLCQKCFLS